MSHPRKRETPLCVETHEYRGRVVKKPGSYPTEVWYRNHGHKRPPGQEQAPICKACKLYYERQQTTATENIAAILEVQWSGSESDSEEVSGSRCESTPSVVTDQPGGMLASTAGFHNRSSLEPHEHLRAGINTFDHLLAASPAVASQADAPSFVEMPSTSYVEPSSIFSDCNEITFDQDASYHDRDTAIDDVKKICELLRMEAPPGYSDNNLKNLYAGIKEAVRKILLPIPVNPLDFSPVVGAIGTLPNVKACASCENLVDGLANRFRHATHRNIKFQILTCVPQNYSLKSVQEKFGCGYKLAKSAAILREESGPFSAPPPQYRYRLPQQRLELVREYYYNNSRIDPSLRATVFVKDSSGKKILTAKRALLMTQTEFYAKFKQDHPNELLSLSSFVRLKPDECTWAGGKGFMNSCTCESHENFSLMLEAAGIQENATEVLTKLFCDVKDSTCMLGKCPDCPKDFSEVYSSCFEESETILLRSWASSKSVQGTRIVDELLLKEDFIDRVQRFLPKFARHYFVTKKQKTYIEAFKKQHVTKKMIVVTVDFAMNYTCVTQNATQGAHWTNIQCTMHPFVVDYIHPETGNPAQFNYVAISDNLVHDATAFHAFRSRVVADIKEKLPDVEEIVYVSDGAPSQYKNFKNIANLVQHIAEYLRKAQWIFFATSHGKSPCDALGATLKRAARLASLKLSPEHRCRIQSPRELFEFLEQQCVGSEINTVLSDAKGFHRTKPIYVTKVEVETAAALLCDRYSSMKRIPGIRKAHHFRITIAGELEFKEFSDCVESTIITTASNTLQDIEAMICVVGIYVAVCVKSKYLIGLVTEVPNTDGGFNAQLMIQNGSTNKFQWHTNDKVAGFDFHDIITVVSDPVLKDGLFCLCDNDYLYLQNKF